MTTPAALARTLERLALGAAALALGTWATIAALRAGYAFQLEWMEGGLLAEVRRVLAGQALFVTPGLEYAPLPYPPLFFWLAALVAEVVGEGFLALRLVSIGATCVTCALLARIARRETGSGAAGLAAAGLYAAAFQWGGSWFDLARVDALALALALFAVERAQARALGSSAALAVLAALAKQNTLLITAPLAWTFLRGDSPRAAGRYVGLVALGCGLAYGALHVASDGASTWCLFTQLAHHPLARVPRFWTVDLPWLLPSIALALLAARSSARARRDLAPATTGALLAAWVGRAHLGGYDNTLLPAALGLAVLAGAAWRPDASAARRALVAALVLAQVALLAYDPRPQIPRAADRAALEALVAELAAIEGPILAPYDGYLAVRAGHADSAHAMTFFDLSASGSPQADRLVGELGTALTEGRYGALLLIERDPFDWLVGERYLPARPILERDRALPRSGIAHGARFLRLRR